MYSPILLLIALINLLIRFLWQDYWIVTFSIII